MKKSKNRDKMRRLIEAEVIDLDYPLDNRDVRDVVESALEFSEIATGKEIRAYIEECLELLPLHLKGDTSHV